MRHYTPVFKIHSTAPKTARAGTGSGSPFGDVFPGKNAPGLELNSETSDSTPGLLQSKIAAERIPKGFHPRAPWWVSR